MSSRTALMAAATSAAVVLVSGAVGTPTAAAQDPAGVTRIFGADRYATAAAAALQEWDTASTVVVASGRGGTDALAAASLAGASSAPVLLTDRNRAPAETLAALTELDAERVLVLGGEAAIGEEAFAQLTAGRTGSRVEGKDRYATAAEVLRASPGPGSTVFLARGDVREGQVPADALAASPLAHHGVIPVLLTAHDELPEVTRQALVTAGVTSVVVLGGPAAVSQPVVDAVDRLPGVAVRRIAGDDRSGTAAELAELAVAGGGFTGSSVGLASGTSVDALAAGPVASRAGYPLLLTVGSDDLGDGSRAYLKAHADTLTSTVVFGGDAAITPGVVRAAQVAREAGLTDGDSVAVEPPAAPPASGAAPPSTPGSGSSPSGGGSGAAEPVATPPATSSGPVRYPRARVEQAGGATAIVAMTDSWQEVRYDLRPTDLFSLDGVRIGRHDLAFRVMMGRALTVSSRGEQRWFDIAWDDAVPSGGLAPRAELSQDEATVEVSWPYQSEIDDRAHPTTVHVTADDPAAADALWEVPYATASPVLDRAANRWTVRLAAPDAPGTYAYRVMTNVGTHTTSWAWGHTATPVEVSGPAPTTVRYTGAWLVDSATDTSVTASQNGVLRTFPLPARPRSVPAGTATFLSVTTPGTLVQIDHRGGRPDDLVALDEPTNGWRNTAADVEVTENGSDLTVTWTNPRGRALSGVRVYRAARTAPWDPPADLQLVHESTDGALLTAGGSASVSFPRTGGGSASVAYRVVLDGPGGVSSISVPASVGGSPQPGPTDPGPSQGVPSATTTYDRFFVDGDKVRGFRRDGTEVLFTIEDGDFFSRDGQSTTRRAFVDSYGGGGLRVLTREGHQWFSAQVGEPLPASAQLVTAEASADGSFVTLAWPYQEESWRSAEVQVTTDPEGADDRLWSAPYALGDLTPDPTARTTSLRLAPPEEAGSYTYRVKVNDADGAYAWAWASTAAPLEVEASGAPLPIYYSGGWTVDSLTATSLTATQGRFTRTFELPTADGTQLPGTTFASTLRAGSSVVIDHREGHAANVIAVDGPGSGEWPQTPRNVTVDRDGEDPVIRWTYPSGRAITGVRVLRTTQSNQSGYHFTPPELVRSFAVDPSAVGGTSGETDIEDVDAAGSRVMYRIVLDGPGGVSAISELRLVSRGW